MKSIGVTSIDPWFILDDESLTKNLLYFDKLVYNCGRKDLLENFCRTLPKGADYFKAKMNEIDILTEANLLSHYKDEDATYDAQRYGDKRSIEYLEKSAELALEFSTKKSFKEVMIDFLERFREVGQLRARNYALLLNNKYSDYYTPIIRTNNYAFDNSIDTTPATTLKVVLSKFPQLAPITNMQKFIDFKNDPQTQIKLIRLKNWVLEITKKNYSEKEIEQTLDYLLQEYLNQLDIHKLKYKVGIAETLIIASLEAIENLIQLKFSTAAKTLFALRKEKVNLLENELTIDGKEIAFIYHAINDKRLNS